MRRILLIILLLFLWFTTFAQTIYSWTPGVNPGWTSSSSAFTWHTSCNALTTNCTGNYTNNINSYYESPVINTSSCYGTTATVSFMINGRAECYYDYLYIQYSSDNGITWTNLWVVNCNNSINMTGDINFINVLISHVVPTASNFIYRLGFTSDFSQVRTGYKITDFKIECNVVLSADIISFNGVNKQLYNEITWNTESELNNDYFQLEHSSNGIDWHILNKQNTSGNKSSYVYKHNNFVKQNYYKLSAIDLDGNIRTHSEIVYIENDIPEIESIYNLLGQKVEENYKGIFLIKYKNGKIEKRIK